jgi:hypothetical protein
MVWTTCLLKPACLLILPFFRIFYFVIKGWCDEFVSLTYNFGIMYFIHLFLISEFYNRKFGLAFVHSFLHWDYNRRRGCRDALFARSAMFLCSVSYLELNFLRKQCTHFMLHSLYYIFLFVQVVYWALSSTTR